jgi:hypothetical protein
MDRILFGDNQFFGVNHMSEDKARAQQIRFQHLDAVMDVLDVAYEEGIRTFMCTTHEKVAQICDVVRNKPERYANFQFYPCMPYAHKYANAVTEHGILEALRKFLPSDGAVGAMLKGGLALASRDVDEIIRMLVDAEMQMFKGLNTPVIFLQNVVTDLVLGLGMPHCFKVFSDYVQSKYKAEAGFITMNLPSLLDSLEAVNIPNPIVCANINKIGFRMSGGLEAYETIIEEREFRAIAMSVFASGAIPAAEALQYVCDQPKIEAIVFGASSRGNIKQTKSLIDSLSRPPPRVA